MRVGFKRLHKYASIPEPAHEGDFCCDAVAVTVKVTDNYIEYGLGFAADIPPGWAILLYPRSSISKKDLSLCNGVGVVDSNYKGEICARFKPTKVNLPDIFHENGSISIGRSGDPGNLYVVGDRVVQMSLVPYHPIEWEEVEEIGESERGSGGFGSSGN